MPLWGARVSTFAIEAVLSASPSELAEKLNLPRTTLKTLTEKAPSNVECEEAMSSYRARRQAEALAAQSRPCGYADFARPYLLAQGLALANGTES